MKVSQSIEPARKVIFNPFLASFKSDPYPTYHRLRESDPVHKSSLNGAWVLTRYADIKNVLRDPRFRVEQLSGRIAAKSKVVPGAAGDFAPLAIATGTWLLFLDPPDHTRLRSLVGKAFSSAEVERLRGQIREMVNQLLDRVKDCERLDLIAALAAPLPVMVIAQMLGLPAADLDKLRHWADELSRVVDPLRSIGDYEYLNEVAAEMIDYFRRLIGERRLALGEDRLSALIAAREQEDKLSENELLSICIFLFVAGEETTVNLIGNGMLALLRSPEQMGQLQQHPELMPTAVEELLRYDSPAQFTSRVATEEIELGGKIIGAGELVYLCIGAANRDPAQFADPDRLDLARSDNRHLAFADGIHYCLGSILARLEGQIAIEAIVQTFPNLKLSPEPLAWRENIILRGLKSLPVTTR
jgi:pimeloyl-[acyl-carrier protein] synthase